MRRLRITLAYDGTDFHGWQVQPGLATIQQQLENILETIEGTAVKVAGSGRTDAGVHAERQVAACSLNNPIPPHNLRRALNRLLPPAIRILNVEEVGPEFHPRFDAVAKTYEYRIFRGEICDPFRWRYVYHHPYPLDLDAMTHMAGLLEGEHDFRGFATADPRYEDGRSTVRTIYSSTLHLERQVLTFRVRGKGFLKHMIRNLTGFLLEAGKHNVTPERLLAILQNPSTERAGTSVPAKGLTLCNVEYPPAEFLIR